MDNLHTIGALLGRGAAPSREEASDLAQVGAFVASFFARHLHGVSAADHGSFAARAGAFASSLHGRLSASTATRWTDGIGLIGSLLSDLWRGYWQVGLGGPNYGYEGFDPFERTTVALWDETPEALDPVIAAARLKAGSLFGPRKRPSAARRQGTRRPAPWAASAPTLLALLGGDTLAPAALEALEEGGLSLDDQITAMGWDEAPATAALVTPSAQAPAVPAPAARRWQQLRRPARRRSSFAARGVSLDGLRVDSRTPALASALGWAEAMFDEAFTEPSGLSVTSHGLARLLGEPASAAGGLSDSPGGVDAPSRPVFAFFDAVEGDFLRLQDESPVDILTPAEQSSPRRAPRGEVGVSLDRMVAPSRSSMVRPLTAGIFQTSLPAPGPGHVTPMGVRADGAGALDLDYVEGVATSVEDPVTVASVGTPAPQVLAGRPPAVSVDRPRPPQPHPMAAAVVHDRGGRPVARVQRGNMAAPRVAIRAHAPAATRARRAALTPPGRRADVAMPLTDAVVPFAPSAVSAPPLIDGPWDPEPRVSPQWRLEADLGPDLPLGASLTGTELFAGQIAATQAGMGAPWAGGVPSAVTAAASLQRATAPGAALGPSVEMWAPGASAWAGPTTTPEAAPFEGALEGVAWVSTPAEAGESTPTTTVERQLARMPLSAVPVGRRASMVPARALVPVSPAASSTAERAAARGGVMAEPRLLQVLAGAPATSLAGAAATLDAAAASGEGGPFAVAQPLGLPGQTSAALARAPVGLAPEAAPAAFGARPATFEGLGAGPLARHDAPRFGYGSYAWTEADRTYTRLVDEASLPPQVVPGAIAPGPVAAGVAAAGELGTPSAVHAPAADDFRAVQPRLVPTAAVTTRHQAMAAIRQAESHSVATAARRALQRTVVTARERMAVTRLFTPTAAEAPVSPVSRPLPAGVAQLLKRVIGADAPASSTMVSRAPALTESVRTLATLTRTDPVASRQVARELRAAGWAPAELRMLALPTEHLRPSEGPTATEPRISSPRADGSPGIDALPSEGVPASAPTTDERPDAVGRRTPAAMAAHQAEVRVDRMVRNLARIVAGVESLASPTASPTLSPAGLASMVTSVTRGLVADGSRGDYFGALAPARAQVVRTSLREALGELVALAEGAHGAADTVVPADVAAGVMRRLTTARTALTSVPSLTAPASRPGVTPDADAAFSEAPRGVEAFAEAVAGGALVSPAARSAVEAAAPGRAPQISAGVPSDLGALVTLEARVADVLAASSAGPAGVKRMVAPLKRTATPMRRPPVSPTPGPLSPPTSRRAPRVAAQRELGLPLTLGSVVAPEAMLQGMRAPSLALQRQVETAPRAFAAARGEMPGELAGLVDTAAPEAAFSPVDSGARQAPTSAPPGLLTPGVEAGGVVSDSISRLVAMLEADQGDRAASALGVPMSRLNALARGLERHGRASILAEHGVSDFAFAWLSRIDGSKSGLDLGFSELHEELDTTFAAVAPDRPSAVATTSPIADAGYVQTATPAMADSESTGVGERSGLRQVVAASTRAAGASARQHAAADAFRQMNWGYVDTGSRGSTAHADLGGLAATVAGQPGAGSAIPMPLVAPAVKAVAQTAMRKPESEPIARPDAAAQSAASSASDGGGATAAPKGPSPEELAYAVLPKIQQILKRENERRNALS